MGAGESKGKEPEILNVFTPEERQNIHKLYRHIISSQTVLTEPFLKKYLYQWSDLEPVVFSAVCNCNANKGTIQDGKISEIHFGTFLAQTLKGTHAERADIVCLLSGQEYGGQEYGSVQLRRLYQTVFSVVKYYTLLGESDDPRATWKTDIKDDDISRIALSFLSLQTLSETENEQDRKCQYDVEQWISKCPMFSKMFDRVFTAMFPIIAKDSLHDICQSMLPIASNIDWTKSTTLLDTLSISFINYHLPREHQSIWRFLYSNSLHGDSFSQLTRYILGKGPNVILVQDKQGHLFGAYVSDSWEIKPTFYGNSTCFLFSLKPKFGIYSATGYNENYMYFNQGQETMPNGLGLGGQLNYFGLWIDYTFNSGHSKAVPKCTTYGSPQLSGSSEFVVDHIEVWAVGPEKKSDDSDDEDVKTSILDKDVAAKAILELAGKKQHSEGLRELAEDEKEMTEEEKKKFNTIPKLL
ncbi:TLD domain-containing protein 1 [Mactra antiquata]